MPTLLQTSILILFQLLITSEALHSHVFPEKLQIEVNKSIKIQCTINPLDGRNSTDLYFERPNVGRVPQHLLKIINSTTVEFKIDEADENDSGLYGCYVQTSSQSGSSSGSGIGMTHVSVGHKPTHVNDFKCRSYNWDVMNCSFMKPLNRVPTIFTIDYRLENNNAYWIPCNVTVSDTMVSCVPSSYQKAHKFFIFRIQMENGLGNYTQMVQIDNFSSIIPAEPRNLTYSSLTSRSITLSWEIPYELITLKSYNKIDFVHDVQLCSEYDSKWIVIEPGQLKLNKPSKNQLYYLVEVNDLAYANAWYDVRVRFRIDNAIDPDNMWSNASTLIFRTKSRKPDRPPTIGPGAFYINDYNEVTIYWKELMRSERNGNNTHYVITSVKKAGRLVNVEPAVITNTMAKFSKLDTESDYEFTVKAKNDDGESNDVSYIRVPGAKSRLSHPRKLKKSSLGNVYHLTWEPNVDILEQGRVKYTVFWCKPKNSLNNACDGGFDFAEVDQDTYEFRLEKNESVNFAIAVTNAISSSGMSWTMCTAALPAEIGQIKTIWVKHIEARQMEIEWKLECEDSLIVQRYNISYCPLKAIINPKVQECKEPEISVNVSSNATKYNIADLSPYTTYKITISMYSESRQGPRSKALENTTLEAAPTPPLGFKAYDVRNTSMMLEWRIPEQINGVLMYYEIFYNGHSIKINDVENDTTKEPYEVMRYHLQNLTSFTQYELVVRACTKYCSLNSVTDKRTTTVGVPGTIMQPITQVNDSFVEISWQEPSFKGGHIEFYELLTITKRGNQVKREITQICGIHNMCRREPLCTDGSEIYEFYVRPVNVIFSPHAKLTNISCAADSRYTNYYLNLTNDAHAERYIDNGHNVQSVVGTQRHSTRHHHQSCKCDHEDKNLKNLLARDRYALLLPGNWSKPSVTNCYHTAGIDGKTIATIVCSIALMLTMLLVSYKLYKKMKDLKNIVIVLPPGLEGITEEVKPSDLEKKPKPDIINNGISSSLFNGGEEDRLLRRRAESNSSGRSQSDESHSQSNNSLGDSVDDNTYDAQQLMEDDLQSLNSGQIDQDFKNTMSPLENDLNSAPLKKIISSTPTRSNMVSTAPSYPAMEGGYIKPNMMCPNAQGYVKHTAMGNARQPPPSTNGYIPVNQYGQPILNSIPLETYENTVDVNNVKLNMKTPIVASTDASGISGYVTHKQLSDFGKQMQ